MSSKTILLAVEVEDEALVARVSETVSRMMTGLLMEGAECRLTMYDTPTVEDD